VRDGVPFAFNEEVSFTCLFARARRQVARALSPLLKASSTDEEKIAVLVEMICRAGHGAGTKSAALLVLMSTLENASHPKALANLAKHLHAVVS
jgi:hypothetical protein